MFKSWIYLIQNTVKTLILCNRNVILNITV